MRRSLRLRLVVTSAAVLAGFLGLVGLAIERAFESGALELVRERLETRIHGLLAVAEVDDDGRLSMAVELPDRRYAFPDSGLYAEIVDDERRALWRLPSAVGRSLDSPPPTSPGIATFGSGRMSDDSPELPSLLAMTLAVDWELGDGRLERLEFRVAESRSGLVEQQTRFRATLWPLLAASAAALVLLQALLMTWGLSPLGRVAGEVKAVEAGDQGQIEGTYPSELQPLTEALNDLVDADRRRIHRHRNALGDLAHTLKTPLAVLRAAESGNEDTLRRSVGEQVDRMDRVVQVQLQRAAIKGRAGLSAPRPVAPAVESLINALSRVYVGRGLSLEAEIDPEARFRGDEEDLMELLGNLMDNACKFARSVVRVSARPAAGGGNGGLELVVEDDGPGIDPEAAEALLLRGARADTTVAGQGLGLAMVRELVCEAYEGELSIDTSPLGGAAVTASIRFGH